MKLESVKDGDGFALWATGVEHDEKEWVVTVSVDSDRNIESGLASYWVPGGTGNLIFNYARDEEACIPVELVLNEWKKRQYNVT